VSIPRRAASFLTGLGLGFAFTLLLAAALPLAICDRSFSVRSGSMTPTIETGDVVVTEPISPLEARVGQIVTFRDPEGGERLYSHRVQSIAPDGDQVHFVTRGDANTSTEHWSVPRDGSIGRVVYRIPHLGFAIAWLSTPPARLALVVLPALALCWMALSRIWRTPGSDPVPGGGKRESDDGPA
jgi:signal peptidase I